VYFEATLIYIFVYIFFPQTKTAFEQAVRVDLKDSTEAIEPHIGIIGSIQQNKCAIQEIYIWSKLLVRFLNNITVEFNPKRGF
jgi:hypothetical protein